MIDKSAIRIRPYTEADRDQVHETLFLGFSLVSDRIFQKTVRHRSTALSIFVKSLTYTLVLELLLVTLSVVNNNSTTGTGTGTGVGGMMGDFRALQEALMEPTTVQGMVGQFMKPSFMLLGAGITVLVTLATVYSIYSKSQKETQTYIQSCLEEDLGDIVGYYQKDVSTVEKQDKDSKANGNNTGQQQKKKNRSQFWLHASNLTRNWSWAASPSTTWHSTPNPFSPSTSNKVLPPLLSNSPQNSMPSYAVSQSTPTTVVSVSPNS